MSCGSVECRGWDECGAGRYGSARSDEEMERFLSGSRWRAADAPIGAVGAGRDVAKRLRAEPGAAR
ncbi:hypothetical protein GCM10023238_36710 [Streptomyces heliomycini]